MPVGFLGAAEVSNPPRHWVQGVRRAFKGRFESLPAIAGGMTGYVRDGVGSCATVDVAVGTCPHGEDCRFSDDATERIYRGV